MFLFFVVSPTMLGLMAGMTQVNRCLEEYLKYWVFLGDDVLCFLILLFGSTVDTIQIYVSLERPGFLVQNCSTLRKFRSCSSSMVVDISFRSADADSHGLTIQKTTETLLLLLNTVIRASSIAPCIWQSCVRCSVFACGVPDYGFSGEMTSGMVSVCSTLWFDSGYMSASVYGGFWKNFTLF